MALTNFRAELWSKAFMYNLNRRHVHAAVMNRDYEGEIKKAGDTLRISSIGRITISTYTDNSGLGGTAASPTIAGIARPEILQGSSLYLTIDQKKYFNFAIDDVDKTQDSLPLMDKAMKEAAYGMDNTIDLFCNSTMQTGVSGTTDGTGTRLTARTVGIGAGDDDAFALLIELGVKLRENDVFDDDLWAIVPPWFSGLLAQDVRFTGYGKTSNSEALLNGKVGRAAGFEIRESNNLSGATAGTIAAAGGVYTILAGSKSAATFGEQLSEVEAFKPQDGFGEAVKGLHIYGAKVTRPYAISSCAVTKA